MFRCRAYSLLILLSLASFAQTAQKTVKSPITIRVTDDTGAAVTGAQVELVGRKGCFVATKAGPDGSVSLELPQDQYELLVRAPAFRLTKRNVYVGVGPKEISATLKVASCAECIDFGSKSLTLVVLDESGKPIPGVRIWFFAARDAFSALNSADGKARLTLPVAQYEFVLAKEGFVPHIGQVVMDPAEETTLKVTLNAGEGCSNAPMRN
jgi:hypothetical protein